MTSVKLRTAMTMAAYRNNVARDVAEQVGISFSTLGGRGPTVASCFDHINICGRSAFILPDQIARGELRRLRDSQNTDDRAEWNFRFRCYRTFYARPTGGLSANS